MSLDILNVIIGFLGAVGSFLVMHNMEIQHKHFKLYFLMFTAFTWMFLGDLDILLGKPDHFYSFNPTLWSLEIPRYMAFRALIVIGVWAELIRIRIVQHP